jgi:hypothetical protein
MFASYLKKDGKNILQVYQKNAISSYINALAPKRNTINYRKRSPIGKTKVFSLPLAISKRTEEIRYARLNEQHKDLLQEFSLFLKILDKYDNKYMQLKLVK